MSIITLTFSPCIDKTTSVPAVVPDKKLRCSSPVLEPGGGGVNVARAIHQLGGDAIAIYLAGGYTGQYFNHLVEKEKVPHIVIETEGETRENVIVVDESTNHQFRFGMPGSFVNVNEWKKCLAVIEDIEKIDYLVVSGSLPPGLPPDIFKRLSRLAIKKESKLVVDTAGEPLKQALASGVYLVKPNLGELASLAGVDHIEQADVIQVARRVLGKYHCEMMAVSMGEDGAILITPDEAHQAFPPKVVRKSTVGAGDSMVAGLVFALSKGMSLGATNRFGVACGTAATLNPGTGLCHKGDVDRLYETICLENYKPGEYA